MRKDAVTAAMQNMMSLTLRMAPVCAVAISTNSRHGRHILKLHLHKYRAQSDYDEYRSYDIQTVNKAVKQIKPFLQRAAIS